MNTSKSLWGDLPLADAIRTPIAILREQATILTELTHGLLEGVVTNRLTDESSIVFSISLKKPKEFSAVLSIVAPALDGYVFRILQMDYDLELYPVEIENLASEIGDSFTSCNNEQELMQAIGNVLSSESVRRAIRMLLAQSKSTAPA
jgi:hypothetical protein